MKIGMFTDPHIGLKRLSGTTSATQDRLKELLYTKATQAASTLWGLNVDYVACLGDLFDKFSNSEKEITQGFNLVGNVSFVLAGNHDISNQKTKVGSLQLIAEVGMPGPFADMCISPDPSKPFFYELVPKMVYAVPHCLSGEIFEESLREVMKAASSNVGENYLFLHCNVGTGFGESKSSHELWLSPEMALELSKIFTRVIVGHEHEPTYYKVKSKSSASFEVCDLAEASVVILGNTYPLSFGEVSNRYVYVLDTFTGVIERHLSVDAKEVLTIIDAGEVTAGTAKSETPYAKITGLVPYKDSAKFNSNLYNLFANSPDILMIGKYYEEEGKGLERIKATGLRPIQEIIEEAAKKEGFLDILKEIQNA
jgi:DNA repair exonuclease SbcCD nuclease subunit